MYYINAVCYEVDLNVNKEVKTTNRRGTLYCFRKRGGGASGGGVLTRNPFSMTSILTRK